MSKTAVKPGITIKKAVELAKPFVGSLRMKIASRPVLKTALVSSEYVIATDSHRLIRIKHDEHVSESYLHHYKKELTQDMDAASYPDTSRLLPDTNNAQSVFTIDIVEWLEAHTLALIAAKEHKNRVIHLAGNELTVNAVETVINAKGKEEKQPNFEKIGFKYSLDSVTPIEKVSYNCEYMLDILKAFKKAGYKEANLYFYGKLRPMLFVSGDIEAILLPVKSY